MLQKRLRTKREFAKKDRNIRLDRSLLTRNAGVPFYSPALAGMGGNRSWGFSARCNLVKGGRAENKGPIKQIPSVVVSGVFSPQSWPCHTWASGTLVSQDKKRQNKMWLNNKIKTITMRQRYYGRKVHGKRNGKV